MPGSRVRRGVLRLVAPLALFALVWAVATFFRVGEDWRATLLALGGEAAGALALLSLAARGSSRPLACATLAAAPVLTLLRPGTPLQLAALAVVLGLALAALVADRFARDVPEAGAMTWIGVALVAQALVGPHLIIAAAPDLVILVAVPLVCGAALASVASDAPRVARVLGLGLFAAGPGFGAAACLAVGAAVVLARVQSTRGRVLVVLAPCFAAAPALGERDLWTATGILALATLALVPPPRLASKALAPLGAAALVALLGASLPWSRERPLRDAFGVLFERPLAEIVDVQPPEGALLTSEAPRLVFDLPPGEVRRLVIESSGVELASLACGTHLARVVLLDQGSKVFETWLAVGAGGGDWAAQRADVQRHLSCPSTPRLSWLPPGARFLGSTFGTSVDVSGPIRADRVVVQRTDDLPDAAQIHLVRLGIGR